MLLRAGERDVGDDVVLADVERVHERAQRAELERRLGELDGRRLDRIERLPGRVGEREAQLVRAGPAGRDRVGDGAGAAGQRELDGVGRQRSPAAGRPTPTTPASGRRART